MDLCYKTNNFVVKWQKPIRPQFWWKFSGHKIENTFLSQIRKKQIE